LITIIVALRRIAAPVDLSEEQRSVLERMARQRTLPARMVERAQIVLRAAEGMENQQIARQMGITPEKVARWRNRFLQGSIAALQKDTPRPGRPPGGRKRTGARTQGQGSTRQPPFILRKPARYCGARLGRRKAADLQTL
jgi:hypothetical protein